MSARVKQREQARTLDMDCGSLLPLSQALAHTFVLVLFSLFCG
jgi:hypothetical protein